MNGTGSAHAPRARMAIRLGAVVLVIVLVVYGRSAVLGPGGLPRPAAQRITLLTPERTLPPPKPQEPVKLEEAREIEIDEGMAVPPEALADALPSDDTLGVDAEGGAGSDAFGLAAKPGGREIITLGPAGGSRRAGEARGDPLAAFAPYNAVLARFIEEGLMRAEGLRTDEFRVIARLWIGHDGKVLRAQIEGTSGDADLDRRLSKALSNLPPAEPPPENMPQPVVLRLQSRMPG